MFSPKACGRESSRIRSCSAAPAVAVPAAFGALPHVPGRGIEALAGVRRQFATSEDVNDDPEGAPSRRIARTVRGYRKRLHGPLVARKAGLMKIRAECPRFRAWLTRLEGLA